MFMIRAGVVLSTVDVPTRERASMGIAAIISPMSARHSKTSTKILAMVSTMTITSTMDTTFTPQVLSPSTIQCGPPKHLTEYFFTYVTLLTPWQKMNTSLSSVKRTGTLVRHGRQEL